MLRSSLDEMTMKEVLVDGAAMPESILFGFDEKENTVMLIEGTDQMFLVAVGRYFEPVSTWSCLKSPLCCSGDGAVFIEFEHESLLGGVVPT